MARRASNRSTKAVIRVFCEGESEQAYIDFLKMQFQDVAAIKYPRGTGLFETAKDKFSKDPKWKDYANEIDEVWFFFDVELKDKAKWTKRHKIMQYISKLRKKPNIKIRLLMTTGCMEYWLMLHYRFFTPSVQTEAEKERMLSAVREKEPNYQKGNKEITTRIAKHYPIAVENAEKTLKNLLSQGLPGLEDTDERNRWLCEKCLTFSTVQEAINYLEELRK